MSTDHARNVGTDGQSAIGQARNGHEFDRATHNLLNSGQSGEKTLTLFMR